LPEKPIQPQVSIETGLVCADSELYINGKPLDTIRIREAISQFLLWLGRFPNPVLVTHNASFDASVMTRTLSNLSIDTTNKINGFVDSVAVLEGVIPGRSHYALRSLAIGVLNEVHDAHNAVANVKMLQKLLNVKEVTDAQMLKHGFSVAYVPELYKYQGCYLENRASLMPLVNDHVLSMQMIGRVAKCGLGLSDLLSAYKKDNFNGIKYIFTQRGADFKPKVTNNIKIMQNVCKYCESLCK
jgi:DNA polymerase III epsilon subunit-like protein